MLNKTQELITGKRRKKEDFMTVVQRRGHITLVNISSVHC